MKITRATLIRLTNEAIEQTPRLGPRQKESLRQVAATAPNILRNGWYSPVLECGCLVGTTLKSFPRDSPRLYEVGCNFNDLLNKHLGQHFGQVESVGIIG